MSLLNSLAESAGREMDFASVSLVLVVTKPFLKHRGATQNQRIIRMSAMGFGGLL